MLAKTHLLAALVVGLFIIQFFVVSQPVLFLVLFCFATILPDIDTSKSKVGKKMWPLSSLLEIVFGHRGFLHSVWIPLGVLFVSVYFGMTFIGTTFMLGYTLHLIVDALTLGGIRFFGPFGSRVKGFFPTGGLTEGFIFMILTVLLFLEVKKYF
jgi:inner membrane protein